MVYYFTDRYILHYLDSLRERRNIKIKDFAEGITSTRNYSRCLAGEAALSFEHLDLFLEKLSMPLYQFGGYVRNTMMYDNYIVFQFCDAVLNGEFQYAHDELFPKIKDKHWEVPLTEKHLPISILYMQYQLGELNRLEALDRINNVLQLSTMLDSNIVNHDDVTLLHLYLNIANDSAKELIAKTYYKHLNKKDLRILSGIIDVTIIYMYILVFQSLITKETMTKQEHQMIASLTENYLEFQQRSLTDLLDFEIFGLLYQYLKKYNVHNEKIIFHYIASTMTHGVPVKLDGVEILIEEQDINTFLRLLNDDAFVSEAMFEGMVKHVDFA